MLKESKDSSCKKEILDVFPQCSGIRQALDFLILSRGIKKPTLQIRLTQNFPM